MPEGKMMIRRKWLLHKSFNPRVLLISALTITLSLTQVTLAAYQPPRDQKSPSGYTDSSGTRGRCKASQAASLRLLAPITHVGQTTSSHPTFAWLLPAQEKIPIEFTLYQIDNNDQLNLAYKLEVESSPGIMKLSLPQTLPGLTTGQRYLWQVEVLCNRNRPSHNLVARAELDIVAMPTNLKNLLARSQNRLQRANLYAEAGMWYDALAEALNCSQGELGKVATSLLQDLANLEKPSKDGISLGMP
ncbi:DUF928 domain-containing protein [Chlorogloeopsis sp. ULAP02]|uniref:DUF928 domain-containing protein n=1 Tax=Chlorogloeopsis sp. ULAP02 TaxID=3107926 RepID=UPI00313577E3